MHIVEAGGVFGLLHRPAKGHPGLMRREESPLDFIGDIYDAALDPALWPEALTRIADFTRGQAAGIFSKESVSKGVTARHTAGFDPRYVRIYEERYASVDPMSPLLFVAVDQVTSTTDFISYDDFRDGAFYQEWARPQGWVDAASAVLDKSTARFDFLAVVRDEASGLVDDEMSARLRLVAPHVRRAVAIGKMAEVGLAQTAVFGDTLDGLSAGVFLVEATGRIVHANIAGRAILADRDFLYSTRERLVARDAEIDRTLRTLFAAAAKGDVAIGTGGIAILLASRDNERHVAHILPLPAGRGQRAGIGNPAVAALFVHAAAVDRPSLPESIARHYRLTPTELRVLLSIVDVGGAPEVAEALGIGAGTVKTHLARVYQKTGTRRHADLVKLVSRFSSPLLS
jgi:DNA-binding CsgD family transcriptional regulator